VLAQVSRAYTTPLLESALTSFTPLDGRFRYSMLVIDTHVFLHTEHAVLRGLRDHLLYVLQSLVNISSHWVNLHPIA
jgi:hypothetical protein